MRPEETPVPIPNTTVKSRTAEGTMLETAWENRRAPELKKSNSASGFQADYHITDWMGFGVLNDWLNLSVSRTLKTAYKINIRLDNNCLITRHPRKVIFKSNLERNDLYLLEKLATRTIGRHKRLSQ